MRRVGFYFALGTLCLSQIVGASSKRAVQHRTHRIYPGQTLGMIAKRYNISVDDLCQANGIQRKSPIKPHQVLTIPNKDELGLAETELAATEESTQELKEAKPAQASSSRAEASTLPRLRQDAPASGRLLRAAPRRLQSDREPRDPYARRPARRGFVTVSSTTGSFRGLVVNREGKVTDEARRAFVRVLASWRTGKQESIHDRLIQMLARVSDHFGGRPIRIVSGFRPYSPQQYTPHSRHNLGHAADFMIPGVPNSSVRDFCLGLGDVGVGFYPNSTFVHLDVRQVPTYWVDYSGPGEAPRYTNAPRSSTASASLAEVGTKALEPVGAYPEIRAVDPASLELDPPQGRTRAPSAHIRAGSSETHGSVGQVPGTL